MHVHKWSCQRRVHLSFPDLDLKLHGFLGCVVRCCGLQEEGLPGWFAAMQTVFGCSKQLGFKERLPHWLTVYGVCGAGRIKRGHCGAAVQWAATGPLGNTGRTGTHRRQCAREAAGSGAGAAPRSNGTDNHHRTTHPQGSHPNPLHPLRFALNHHSHLSATTVLNSALTEMEAQLGNKVEVKNRSGLREAQYLHWTPKKATGHWLLLLFAQKYPSHSRCSPQLQFGMALHILGKDVAVQIATRLIWDLNSNCARNNSNVLPNQSASSEWCLKEETEMSKRRRNSGLVVVVCIGFKAMQRTQTHLLNQVSWHLFTLVPFQEKASIHSSSRLNFYFSFKIKHLLFVGKLLLGSVSILSHAIEPLCFEKCAPFNSCY